MKKIIIDSKHFLEIETKKEYNQALKKINANDSAGREYCRQNKTNSIPAEIYTKFPFAKVATNELKSAVETYEFINNPPLKYFAYISEEKRTLTTWTGQKLGNVFFGNVYRSNFGDKRQQITVKTIKGLTYYGIFFKSAGDYCTIKLSVQDRKKLNL